MLVLEPVLRLVENKNLNGGITMKKLLSVMLCICLCLSVGVTAFAHGDNNALTVDGYKQWLSTTSTKADTLDSNRLEMLMAFESLGEKQQELFVSYLNDKQLMSEIMEAFMNDEPSTFANGNIIITSVESIPNVIAKAQTKASHTRTISFLGIDVVQVQNYVTYNHTSTTITGIVKGGMVTVKNYTPFLGISYSNSTTYYTSTRAYHVADLTCSFLFENSGIVYGSAEFGVYGTPSGGVGYWVTKY
jgi:hypothetical protein